MNRLRILVYLCLLGAALATMAFAAAQQPTGDPFSTEIRKIKDGLFVIPGYDGAVTGGNVAVRVTSEGTIYPLLSRLRREGWVSTTWAESESGPPRRYYAITPAGRRALDAFTAEWRRFRDAVDQLLPGDPQ